MKGQVATKEVAASPSIAPPQPLFLSQAYDRRLPILEANKRDDLEERLLEGLVQRELASINTLHQLGLLYERRGQLDRAHQTLEKVAQGEPISAKLLLELARIAHKQGDHKGTLGYLAHARDLEPQNAGIHFFFGMVCVDLDLSQDAYNSLK